MNKNTVYSSRSKRKNPPLLYRVCAEPLRTGSRNGAELELCHDGKPAKHSHGGRGLNDGRNGRMAVLGSIKNGIHPHGVVIRCYS
jgi:hypothetical protein